ncbi:RagB/SusD family nutrient uptake outer membrane protein [Aestuariibaculum lutulentum]|uniref:RagB/SusD family nutrient uptake outer membrane protein n=1 Tax=Aestuariibaculum lutulentum TaxID=2920935 RepID=A0ABS9RFG1_9FLAO|nr:RagB/SusD family nutrient uptake outer membrane protein [Aestuariibaculum lutulentum]MCH4551685.1 RagB/SusD family nutrient uptake outer membrane protein [Aestuariibaculum lutulentum]
MKKIKLYIYTAISSLILFNCSGYLDEENLGNTTAENFYNTETGFEGLVNSAYATLRDVYQPTPYMFCAGTDLFFAAHQEVPLGLASYQTLTPSEGAVETLFSNLYKSIQITNLALHYANETENFSSLPSRIAELKVIRAYYYFLLVQEFGDTSLVTDLVDSPITHFERAASSDVYEFIIDELTVAINDLPPSPSNFGRLTKRAAQHILAKVYLTRGYETFGSTSDFTEAATLADAAIGGQSLNLSFNQLFDYQNDNNEEILWSIQYNKSQSGEVSHNWDYPWGPLVQGSDDGVNKKNTLHPTEYLFTLFDDNDKRFEGTFLNIKTTPYSGWLLDPSNTPVQYYYPRTAAQIAGVAAWIAEDPNNRSNTIISPIDPHWWDGLNQTDYPSLRKFDRVQTSSVQYTHDIYLARLGETYLIAAEAYLQSNNPGNALARVNTVRQRAGADSVSNVDLDFILEERARELAGEGMRWLDLKRTRKLMEYTKLRNPDIKTLVDGGVDPFLSSDGNYKILRPIPLSAIALDSGDYPQNPGY